MKAAVYNGKDKTELKDISKPELQGTGAVIKVYGCGLCGSDIVKIRDNLVAEGAVLGHEVVGEIAEISSNTAFKAGDKVVLGHHVPCYRCIFCKNENYSMCKEFKKTNILPGGFAEYIYVSESHLENTVFKLPEGLSEVEASFMEPAACCLRAIKRANVKVGDNVLIVGLGSIGLLMGQIAKTRGAFVSGCDLLQDRLDLALSLGFDKVYKFDGIEKTAAEIVTDSADTGADKVFLVAGNASTLPFALASVRDGGTIVVFASVASEEAGFANNEIYYRELTVMGSYSPSPEDLEESLDKIKNAKIKVDFSSIYELDKVDEAIADTLSNKILKGYIKIS